MSTLVVTTLVIAAFAIGGVVFSSLSGSPPTIVTTGYSPIVDDFKSLESARPKSPPLTTTGQGPMP